MLRNDSAEGKALHSFSGSGQGWKGGMGYRGVEGFRNRQTIDVNNIMDIELEPRQ